MKSKFVAASLSILSVLILLASSSEVLAHVSEQGIVLLLPTGTYILSGCLAVIFSMVIVTMLPHRMVFSIFSTKELKLRLLEPLFLNQRLRNVTSIASLTLVIWLIILGLIGSRDPLTNLLPLTIWTFFWILLYMLHCLMGNIWAWVNPWTGVWNLVARNPKGLFDMPHWVDKWSAIILFFIFYLFIIVDLAPDDPARLAIVVFSYLSFNFLGIALFGRQSWMNNVECFTVLFTLLSRLAPLHHDTRSNTWRIGLFGWRSLTEKTSLSEAVFLLTVLACGSFDGLNETFWWLAQIGINPLAFPGRSAVVIQSTTGMFIALFLVCTIFAITVCLSTVLVRYFTNNSEEHDKKYVLLFNMMALTVLPITAVYHGSHYYISFLVNSQYLVAALSDPFSAGANYLRLVDYQVTTGYLGDIASVRKIWLTQAGLVVFGHILAVLTAHYLIARQFPSRKDAIAFHVPIAIFMAAYTWFGLWLLAAPKGA